MQISSRNENQILKRKSDIDITTTFNNMSSLAKTVMELAKKLLDLLMEVMKMSKKLYDSGKSDFKDILKPGNSTSSKQKQKGSKAGHLHTHQFNRGVHGHYHYHAPTNSLTYTNPEGNQLQLTNGG